MSNFVERFSRQSGELEIHKCIRAACESYAESPGMISLEGLER